MKNRDIIKDINEWLVKLKYGPFSARNAYMKGILKFKKAVEEYEEWDFPVNWVTHAHALWEIRMRHIPSAV